MSIERFSTPQALEDVIRSYADAVSPAVLSDYDGVLTEIQTLPEMAAPTPVVIETIQRITSDPGTTFAIITGRDKPTVASWFKGLDIELSAEHGSLRKAKTGAWVVEHSLSPQARMAVAAVVDEAIAALPDSFKEEKEAGGIAWHYRVAAERNLETTLAQAHALLASLERLKREMPINVIDGDRVIEAQPLGATKGVACQPWLRGNHDWVLYLGDDTTDADAVAAVEASTVANKHTIGVGSKDIGARLQVRDPLAVRELFDAMSRARRLHRAS